jgi:hypothetical protein
MFGFHATILTPMDITSGVDALNYSVLKCPILSFMCVRSSGQGIVKVTPHSASHIEAVSESGSGSRFRIQCNTLGEIIKLEIVSGGSGYLDGNIQTVIHDPNGSGGEIILESENGKIVRSTIMSPGKDYSGYITMTVDDFIEGVTYNIIPRYIEKEGDGILELVGYKSTTIPIPFTF